MVIQTLRDSLFSAKGVRADVLRLDQLHPRISGNKWYKLKYYLSEAREKNNAGIVSAGGAYSNHLVALAYACREIGLRSAGIIRGADPGMNSPSIQQMVEFGMELIFLDRREYRNKEAFVEKFLTANHGYSYVAEGGQGEAGVLGASEIARYADKSYSDILCAVGTGTTMAGLMRGSQTHQQVTGITILKLQDPDNNALVDFLRAQTAVSDFELLTQYHCGGYAKKNDELIGFMNGLFRDEDIPTDFVYTGKLFYALYDLVKNDHFQRGAKIMVVHSGGLQGNRSLPAGLLDF